MNEAIYSCDMPVASMRKGVVFSTSSSSSWYTNRPPLFVRDKDGLARSSRFG